ncbi:MAG: P-II family nitrogen regulator [Spirochaetaceae bacterium]|nr:P-II family nitrogen regulator [Spirochaetaceae bacterium]
MKHLVIVIRNEKYLETKKELEKEGFSSYSSRDILGRGKGSSLIEVIKKTGRNGGDENGEDQNGEDQKETQGSLLYSRKMMEICVSDKDADTVIEIICRINRNGRHGDGKIFVLPVRDVIRLRTGEKGDNAIL